ncbi:uncharacterized protein LOC129918971 [Episyrphus balteatus]|uniref:uncharacterized protein LOC129918971 n=1 Tax=Episyrphus balteatus TaxID=286459 RepID=UPI0024869EF6|nr:uncharacterized protein LOC129918971 [Episyrphus balteatus]
MAVKNHMNLTNLNLPIFIATRNRIKKHYFSEVLSYITKTWKNNHVLCFEDEFEDDQTVEHFGIEIENQQRENPSSSSKINKNPQSGKSWQLAPNRYTIPSDFGSCKKGIKWSLQKRTPNLKRDGKLKNQATFYKISESLLEKSRNKCNCHKGKFLTDLRNRKPTTRFMISNPITCWRNKNDPGPTTYFVGIFEKPSFKKVPQKHIAPYKFLRYSCVPENVRLRLIGTSSFKPGPGRYELFDDENSLQVSLFVQKQKRLQFRRLHFKRIVFPKQNLLRRHIFGYGFTRLFKGSSTTSSKRLISKKKSHRHVNHEIRMFPSFEYIKMITNPDRKFVSLRTEEELPETLNPLRFNCLIKVHKRRQLRDNKKVVFGSGVPRFKDADISIHRNQCKPPPLINLPVMTINRKNIKTKLDFIPERLRPFYESNRMQPFKFQPIPPVKLLLDENEVHPDRETRLEMYSKELDPKLFFRTTS